MNEANLLKKIEKSHLETIEKNFPSADRIESIRKEEGQSNIVYLINEMIVFRFIKRLDSLKTTKCEFLLLKKLKNRFSLQIPDPISSCLDESSSNPFWSYRFIEGEAFKPSHLNSLNSIEREATAKEIGVFLRKMHSLSDLKSDLPYEDEKKSWKSIREKVSSYLNPYFSNKTKNNVRRVFDKIDKLNLDYEPTPVHGDFGPSNILFSQEKQKITGIIDFSEVRVADPAIDLASFYSPVGYGEKFLKEVMTFYEGGKDLMKRASYYASTFPLQQAVLDIKNGDIKEAKSAIKDFESMDI